MKKMGPLMFLMLLTACSAVRVNYDYDKETDFSDYRSYNYYPELETGLSQLDTKRLLRAVDSILQSKGLIIAEEPDFYINILSQSFRTANNNAVGVGVGGTGGNVGGGISVGIPIGGSGLEREIIFDFVDPRKDALFWQAVSTSDLSDNAAPRTRERKLKEIASKVLAKYPPASNKVHQ